MKGTVVNQDQLIAALRHVLTLVGGIAIGRGWVTNEQLLAASGLIAPLVAIFFAFRSASPAAQIEKVAANPDIAKITPKATPAGAAIAAASPSEKVAL